MKRLSFVFLFSLFLGGCGDRVVDPDDTTDAQLLGMWDSVSNSATVCHERLRLNPDKTFWWFDNKNTTVGTYGRSQSEPQVNFMFTTQAWEVIRFQVTDRELYLTRTGTTRVYTRVPLTSNSSPCPVDSTSTK
jgi:hypothetical protein